MTTPLPGTIGLVATRTFAGLLIRLGTRSKIDHAYIVMSDGVTVFEARPSGAGHAAMSKYPGATFRDDIPLTNEQRFKILASTEPLLGTPYSWLDIAALTVYVFIGRRLPRFVQRRIENTKTLICSQLCDLVYADAGVHLFDDGRSPGEVTPQDLVACMPVKEEN